MVASGVSPFRLRKTSGTCTPSGRSWSKTAQMAILQVSLLRASVNDKNAETTDCRQEQGRVCNSSISHCRCSKDAECRNND